MLHLVRKVRKTSTRRFKDQNHRLRIVLVVAKLHSKLHSKLHLKTYCYLYKCYRADFRPEVIPLIMPRNQVPYHFLGHL